MTGCLHGGVYAGALRINHAGAAGAAITLSSYPGEHATIAGRIYIPHGSDHITLQNLTLDGHNPDTLPSPQINADDITLADNDITNHHTGICIVIGSREWGHATNTTITHNTIHDCGRLPATNHDHGIYVEDATNTTITQNLIHDNADRGINLYYNANHTTITNNTIDHNGEGILFAGDDQTASSNNTVTDNNITNSQIRSDVESSWQPGHTGTNNTLTNNCIHGAKTPIDTGDGGYTPTNNPNTDPHYTNTTTYTPAPNTPCTNKGATSFAAAAASPAAAVVTIVATETSSAAAAAIVQVQGSVTRSPATAPLVVIQRATPAGWKRIARVRARHRSFHAARRLDRPRGARVMRVRAVIAGVGRSRAVRVARRH